MDEHPPIWLIAILALQAALALALLIIGVSLSSSFHAGGRIAATEILAMSVPFIVVLGLAALSWWLWIEGRRKLGCLAAALPIVPVLLFLIVFGMAI